MSDERVSYLLHYARTGSQIWVAHLDVMRTFERACLRARLPLAWSGGYNPRPDLEFALPVGVGIETRREPFLIGLTEAVAAEAIRTRLNRVLPNDLEICAAEPFDRTGTSLMARVQEAEYAIMLENIIRFQSFLAKNERLPADKHSKRGVRTVDVRPGIRAFHFDSDDCLTIRLAAGSQHNIRPDLLLRALAAANGEDDAVWLDADIIRHGVVLN